MFFIEENRLNAQPSDCRRFFGYLSERSKGVEIPEECVACPKSIDCMLCQDKAPAARSVSPTQARASLESLLVGAATTKQKAACVAHARMKIPHPSLIDLATKDVRVCGRTIFNAYCWVAVKIVSLCSFTAFGLQIASDFVKNRLTLMLSRSSEAFLLLDRTLLDVELRVKSLLQTLVNSFSQEHFRMSLSLTRRVKPASSVLHVEALGVAVNIAWIQRPA